MNIKVLALMTALFATACSSSSSTPDTSRLVVAHRGGAALGTENSISTIALGIAAGADMVEVDVHMTADSQLVVCHDATVNRTTEGRGRIEEMTLAEIKKLHLEGTDEAMPTLEEVLSAVRGKCALLLEIKKKQHQYVGIEKHVVQLVRDYGMSDQVVIQSFNKPVLEDIHRLDPELRLELLTFFPPSHPEQYKHIASFNVCHYFITRSFVDKAHRLGKEVKIWTVDSHNRATKLPIDGIITNNPSLFTQAVR